MKNINNIDIQDYFDIFHKIVETDLKEIGCIYSRYYGELDWKNK